MLCSSEEIFNSSDDDVKEEHSEILSYMAYVAHVLPLACGSKEIEGEIFHPTWNFHRKWPLNGWNNDILQPARDAVLEYYQVHVYTTL